MGKKHYFLSIKMPNLLRKLLRIRKKKEFPRLLRQSASYAKKALKFNEITK